MVEKIATTFSLAAAGKQKLKLIKWNKKWSLPRAVASSPSGWAIFCMAVGEIPQGKESVEPN